MVLGGETGGASTDQILLGAPSHLHVAGRLPVAGHDAAAVLLGKRVLLFGGGQASSVDSIVRVDPATGHAAPAGKLSEPLSDLGAVALNGRAYLVGGYTGTLFASAILRYPGEHVVARLPNGTRYAGVAAIGRTIYVAGGITTGGTSDAIYAVTNHVRQIGTLPAPEAHAGMASLGGALYLVGGRQVLRITPSGTVSAAATLPVSLADPAVVAVGRSLVIVGGGTNGVYSFKP
jgi:hypothetical protein